MGGENSTRLAAALAAHAQGRLEEAAREYLALLAEGSEDFRVLLQLGVLRLQQGEIGAALGFMRRALELDPGSAEAHANLATALHLSGDDAAAIASYETAISLDPRRSESYYGLGSALLARSPEEAAACFGRAAALDPDYAEALCGLGATYYALGRHEEALAPFERALSIDPDYIEAQRGRGAALQALGRAREAATYYERAAHLEPAHAPTWVNLAAVQRSLGRHEEALSSYAAALDADPGAVTAYNGRGALLHELGRIEEARTAYQQTLAREPRNVRAHCGLIALAPVAAGDPRLASLEALAAGEPALADDERIALHFALGKALGESGQPERSFQHLIEGNRLRRRQIAYDEAMTLRMLERVSAVFTPELLLRLAAAGDPADVPIFILGMPRSGSTLVEQILVSIPGVHGGGERGDFKDATHRAGLDGGQTPYPESVPGLTARQLRRIAADYLSSLRASAPRALRITDKMLMNFCLVGLIHLALPRARVIHIHRDPLDTCLSCFATHFDQVPYAFDLGELGRYYRAYARLMQHWRNVLPPGVMLDCSYEALVRDFEPTVRRLLAHCGLPWHDACSAFHKTDRPIATASKSQVRQPLYQSSIGRWRPAEAVLQPLIEGLAEVRWTGAGPPDRVS